MLDGHPYEVAGVVPEDAPAVEYAAATTHAPMTGRQLSSSFRVTGRPDLKPGERQSMQVRVVTQDYAARFSG